MAGIDLLLPGDLVLGDPVGQGPGVYREVLSHLADRLARLPHDAYVPVTEIRVLPQAPLLLWHHHFVYMQSSISGWYLIGLLPWGIALALAIAWWRPRR